MLNFIQLTIGTTIANLPLWQFWHCKKGLNILFIVENPRIEFNIYDRGWEVIFNAIFIGTPGDRRELTIEEEDEYLSEIKKFIKNQDWVS